MSELIIPLFRDESSLNTFQLILYVFLGIALIEEFSKWIMLYVLSYNDRNFDELYDMIIYGAFVALGFAFFEIIARLGKIFTGFLPQKPKHTSIANAATVMPVKGNLAILTKTIPMVKTKAALKNEAPYPANSK